MTGKKIIYRLKAAVIGLTLISMLFIWAASGASASLQGKTAGEARKNIQVLKALPDSQLLAVMHIMRASLGVRCDYCHVAENDKYWLDDKPAKQTARKHIQMVLDINKASFGGKPVVTCNTCHQGRARPVSIPPIGQGAFDDTTREDPEARAADPLPAVDQILDRYVEAIGGRAAVEAVKSRVARASLLRPKLINSGTPKAAMINRGETWSIEIYYKAPDKYLAVITSPEGVTHQGYNGRSGWIKTARGVREMNGAETSRVKRLADLSSDLKLKERYSRLTVAGKERVGENDAYVIEALASDNRTEKLFFDTRSGLLVRRIALTETLLGFDPEQIDYEDYRQVDGLRLPFTVRVSYLDDNHFGTTRKYREIKNNVEVADSMFEMPARNQ